MSHSIENQIDGHGRTHRPQQIAAPDALDLTQRGAWTRTNGRRAQPCPNRSQPRSMDRLQHRPATDARHIAPFTCASLPYAQPPITSHLQPHIVAYDAGQGNRKPQTLHRPQGQQITAAGADALHQQPRQDTAAGATIPIKDAGRFNPRTLHTAHHRPQDSPGEAGRPLPASMPGQDRKPRQEAHTQHLLEQIIPQFDTMTGNNRKVSNEPYKKMYQTLLTMTTTKSIITVSKQTKVCIDTV